MRTQCPVCDAWFYLEDDVEVGDRIECPECDAQLKVVSLDPVELDYDLGD
jgi:lysine biosynthesis protein LysW